MRWRVEFSPHALRSLKKLDKPTWTAIVQGLAGLAEELSAGTSLVQVAANVTKLVGVEPPEWRLRAGDYRARFRVDVRTATDAESGQPIEEGIVVVTRLGHRRDVYRD